MKTPMDEVPMARESAEAAARALAGRLDAMAGLALDARISGRLRAARSAALQRSDRSANRVSNHWMNTAPVGLALVLVVLTSWSLLVDSGGSLDAEILADSLPVDAYLDADFEASINRGDVRLLEN